MRVNNLTLITLLVTLLLIDILSGGNLVHNVYDCCMCIIMSDEINNDFGWNYKGGQLISWKPTGCVSLSILPPIIPAR